MGQDLYDEDFYSWTTREAQLLRVKAFDEIDLSNIIEEIETLGRSEESALESFYSVLALHLLKGVFQSRMTTAGWQQSILNNRLGVAKVIRKNPGLKPKRDAAFAEAYRDARKVAALETGLPVNTFPEDAPFTREEAESESFLPARLNWSKEQLRAAAACRSKDGNSRT